jgi:hypothetical protein
MPAPPGSNIQILTALTSSHLIPVKDINRPDINEQQYISPADFQQPADSGYVNPSYPTGAPQVLNGTGALGAVNLTSAQTKITTTGAATGTLAAGTKPGMMKIIRMTIDAGDFVLTATAAAFTTATFGDVGDFLQLFWTGTVWQVMDNDGVVLA